VKVAGHGLDPGVGHPNDGLGKVAIGESNRLEHGAGWGLVSSVSDAVTAVF